MKKIVFVSHCILNTASKVVLYNREDIDAEEKLRLQFLQKALDKGVQIVQLPCPEFTLYGAKDGDMFPISSTIRFSGSTVKKSWNRSSISSRNI